MNLDELRDSESCLTRLSYAGIIRYAATGNRKSVSHALSQLQRLHAIQISRGMRIGITRESSAYRVTLDDLRFLELCNEVHSSGRAQNRRFPRFGPQSILRLVPFVPVGE